MSQDQWQPSAAISSLHSRAQVLQKIRQFFADRHVLEVETPLLCQHSVTDINLEPITANYSMANETTLRYLQTSPEFAMKRLLAAGSGCIYQIAKAFRADDLGKKHNPEFSLLEWYRIGFDHWQLMDEIDLLSQSCFGFKAAEKISYRQLLLNESGLDVLLSPVTEIQDYLSSSMDVSGLDGMSRDDWLDLLFSTQIEPNIGHDQPLIVFGYPKSQAALARTFEYEGEEVAARFELFVKGVEMANGYWELTDVEEQQRRFLEDNRLRRSLNKAERSIDSFLMEAMNCGLPDCAGVAMGIDRMLMVALGLEGVKDTLSFDWGRA